MAASGGSERNVDICVFGASGFTGKFIAQELYSLPAMSGRRLALAGRDRGRLQAVLNSLVCNATTAPPAVEIIVADANDSAAMAAMAAQCRVVLSCAGPFRYLGRAVVAACVASGADYLDISGEPEFLEACVLEFDVRARAAGVYVIGACGWDSVPSDLGVVLFAAAARAAGSPLASVDGYLDMRAPAGAAIHATTLECAVLGFSSRASLARIRSALRARDPNPPRFPHPAPRPRGMVHLAPPSVGGWPAVPFMGADVSIVRRSQRALLAPATASAATRGAAAAGVGGVHYSMYVMMRTATLAKLLLLGAVFRVLVSFEWGRRAIIRHPRLFSLGAFSHQGPTPAQMAATHGYIHFVGRTADRGEFAGRIAFPEPGYVATARIAAACALTILEERAALPPGGGVLTPGAAFAGTSLAPRLAARDIVFTAAPSLPPPPA